MMSLPRIIICLGLLAVGSAAEPAVHPNPLVPQRADPWIHQHSDGYFYFMGTVPEYDRA